MRPAAALAVLAALVRVPSFLRPVWNPDEGFLAVQARMLAQGGVLYDTVVDRKPPLLPWLYEGLFWVFGDGSLWPLRAAAVLAQFVTALLLASVARRRWGDRAGAAAGAGYLLLSICLAPEDAQAASFGVFMLPWTVLAFWAADRRRWALAGLAVAGAALTKQTGGAALLPVLWMLWGALRGPGPAAGRGAVLRLLAGCAVPVVAVALFTGPGRFLFWTVTGSGSYASASGAWGVALGRGLGNAGILAAAGAAFVIPAVYVTARRGRAGRVPARIPADLWVWLGASALAVVFGFQFYGHYFLQLIPPLVLAGVAALRGLPRWRPAATAWTVLASTAFLVWGLTAPRTELDHSRTVAAAVRARTGPGDTVLVWGMHPEQYWIAGRTPASRYLTAGFLTNFSGGRGGARVGEQYAVPGAWRTFGEEMARRPPDLIVDDSRGAPYAPGLTPSLKRLLDAGYRPVDTVGGAVLYARGAARR
ncbi:glycosyltransferase family 39 protein [Streptomyces sp. H10-C2]|uniref:glycosyltransferase family 39 protein n=1 Tax=unclassified Streptomyces TaxID=2593676 RepID=UPI0024B95FB1|nr:MULTISPECIES: glycosyltransferase family 39 protein [unclassified Streptomyces]MDJ0344679.1 glycosyltransferase family 39 protein [Streptomyces sp. PH10-H1]MDJ0372837.1 glycosyltransferase family 39 protein [Streptomyces sp. H10-C2]